MQSSCCFVFIVHEMSNSDLELLSQNHGATIDPAWPMYFGGWLWIARGKMGCRSSHVHMPSLLKHQLPSILKMPTAPSEPWHHLQLLRKWLYIFSLWKKASGAKDLVVSFSLYLIRRETVPALLWHITSYWHMPDYLSWAQHINIFTKKAYQNFYFPEDF